MHERLGSFERKGGQWRLRFVRLLAAPPKTVWRAFVEPELVGLWFPTSIEGALIPGSALRFSFDRLALDDFDGEVLGVEEPVQLSFRWGTDLLFFELDDEHSPGTRLTMSAVIAERGRGARDGAGWHESLAHLERIWSPRSAETDRDSWAEIYPSYVEAFGPAASTIGPPEEHHEARAPEG